MEVSKVVVLPNTAPVVVSVGSKRVVLPPDDTLRDLLSGAKQPDQIEPAKLYCDGRHRAALTVMARNESLPEKPDEKEHETEWSKAAKALGNVQTAMSKGKPLILKPGAQAPK